MQWRRWDGALKLQSLCFTLKSTALLAVPVVWVSTPPWFHAPLLLTAFKKVRFLQEWRFCFCCIAPNMTRSSRCTCSGKRDKRDTFEWCAAACRGCIMKRQHSHEWLFICWQTGGFIFFFLAYVWTLRPHWNMSAAPQGLVSWNAY